MHFLFFLLIFTEQTPPQYVGPSTHASGVSGMFSWLSRETSYVERFSLLEGARARGVKGRSVIEKRRTSFCIAPNKEVLTKIHQTLFLKTKLKMYARTKNIAPTVVNTVTYILTRNSHNFNISKRKLPESFESKLRL